MAHAISRVPGVARVSLAYVCGPDQEEYCQAAVRALGRRANSSPSRSTPAARPRDTSHTLDINRLVGGVLCKEFPTKKVEMHHPDVTVCVYVVQGNVYVYADSMPGVGGLPWVPPARS